MKNRRIANGEKICWPLSRVNPKLVTAMDYFASKAKKDGFVQIAQVFEETARQEKEHAKRFFKFLEGGELENPGRVSSWADWHDG